MYCSGGGPKVIIRDLSLLCTRTLLVSLRVKLNSTPYCSAVQKKHNGPRSIYQYSNMALRLSGRNCKSLNFFLSLNSQKRLGNKENTTKYRSLS